MLLPTIITVADPHEFDLMSISFLIKKGTLRIKWTKNTLETKDIVVHA